ncbi:MAG: L-aspartate oxidase [bacterium]
MERRYDFLIVGSGIAGLFFALEAASLNPRAKLAIVTKKGERDTSTNRAQGGIAAVLGKTDSVEAHINDTLKAGDGLCHRDVVEQVVTAGPAAIEELIAYGVRFTQVNGEFDLGREGGHSSNRVIHAADLTGREIERALLSACRAKASCVDIFRDHIVLDLITYPAGEQEACAGAFVYSQAERAIDAFYAPVTMLATGGLGQVYFHTTNPKIATGDGVAIAWRAGVSAANLEFVQFHPTALYTPGRWPFLISEAVRGEGAILKTVNGRRVMEQTHPLKDLAPRDIVARAIDKTLKESGEEYVLLDASHLDADHIKRRFPNIYKECRRRGFDMTQRSIPVVPSAHYACGGVTATIAGETELAGLYVAGEVAMTGMHGANRLASNSLLEAVVMAKLAAAGSTQYFRDNGLPEVIPVDNSLRSSLDKRGEKILITHERRQLQRVMSDFVGIVRTVNRLNMALDRVHRLKEAIEHHYWTTPATYGVIELRNLTTVAELIVRSSLQRQESRGLHYVEDYDGTDDAYRKDTIIRAETQPRRQHG